MLVAAISPGLTGQFDDGLAAAERGDYTSALRLWRPLADHGDADAQYNLGAMYNNGDGVPRDYAEALRWHRKAADRGNGNAQFHLGLMYDRGLGTARSSAEAAKWYGMAADQGLALAQYKLAIMYLDGEGVPRDYVQAYKWFDVSASRFQISEKEDRENAIRSRDFIASKMTPEEITKAQKLAREWEAHFNL